MNLENVKGVVIDELGREHSFGIHKMETTENLEDENYHDPAFLKDIVPTKWFQSLGYCYDPSRPLRGQIMDMTSYGLTFVLNGNSIDANKKKYYVYVIQAPTNLSEASKKTLEEEYGYLKKLIEKDNALFYGEAYQDGEYIWDDATYNIEDFYNKLSLKKGTNQK